MDEARARAAARHLFGEYAARTAFAPLPAPLRPGSLDEAYAVQEALQDLFSESGRGPIAGYKVAAISPVMQRLLDISHPCGGAIFAGTIRPSPAILRADEFINLAIECEIAVTLGADLPAGADLSREGIASVVQSCSAAIELVEDRWADYRKLSAIDLVADNAWNAGIVQGPPVAAWRALDLTTIAGTMRINGMLVGRGVGGDVRGHPFESVAWIAEMLQRRGRHLRAGMVVMTGSVIETQFVAPGDEVVVAIEGLGEARLSYA